MDNKNNDFHVFWELFLIPRVMFSLSFGLFCSNHLMRFLLRKGWI